MKRTAFFVIVTGLLGLWRVCAQEFTVKSDDLGPRLTEEQVFSGFGCHGRNISPSLRWSDAPNGTRSFAVTLYDPDAPTGRGWWHWIIFNIPPDVHELKKDAGNLEKGLAPKGSVQSITDFGMPGFGGACPPVGDKPHRYVFTVYALDVPRLDLSVKSSPAVVGDFLNQHAIAKASIVSYYGR